MIAKIIPLPYREQLVNAGRNKWEPKTGKQLEVIAAEIDAIKAKCASFYPELFKVESCSV